MLSYELLHQGHKHHPSTHTLKHLWANCRTKPGQTPELFGCTVLLECRGVVCFSTYSAWFSCVFLNSCWWTSEWVWRDMSWVGEKCCSTLMRWVKSKSLFAVHQALPLLKKTVSVCGMRKGLLTGAFSASGKVQKYVITEYWYSSTYPHFYGVLVYIFLFLSHLLRSPASVWHVWPSKQSGNTLWARQRLFRSRSMTTTNQVCLGWIF